MVTEIARRPPTVAGLSAQQLEIIRGFALVFVGGYQRGLAEQVQAPVVRAWLTIPEASEHSGLSQTMIRRLIQSRRLKAFRDRAWKVRRDDLDALDNLAGMAESSKRLKDAVGELKARRAGR